MLSKFIKRGTNKENVPEHENIGQFSKGTREQGPHPPWETLVISDKDTLTESESFYKNLYKSKGMTGTSLDTSVLF